ncbi:MAG: PAS domain S-box protein [FCB group bacterium]|nr:PAS domain S-box protein [FCB group bacterium]
MVNILVVDDEKSIRLTLRSFLKSAGYTVECAESAQIAEEFLKENEVDVVITDLIMRQVSGIDLLKFIRDSRFNTEVIAITGVGDVYSAAEVVALGAFAFFIKPIDRKKLVEAVTQAMNLKKIRDENRRLEAEKEKLHQKTLELLEELEGKYYEIMETIQEGYYEVDLTGNFTYVNASLCAMLKYSSEELIGMNNRQYLDEKSAKAVYSVFNNVYLTGEPKQIFDFKFYTRDGAERYCQISTTLMTDRAGNPQGFHGIVQDITEQKLSYRKLEHSEQRYKALIDNSSIGIILVGVNGEILNINPRLLEILGSPSAEKTMEINMFTFQPVVDAGISESFRQVLESGEPGQFECEYTSIWGKHSCLKYHLNPVFDIKNNLIGIQGTIEDISREKSLLGKLKARENKFRQFYDRLPDAIFICEVGGEYSGRIIDANHAAGEQTGYAINELIGMNIVKDFSVEEEAILEVDKYERELNAGKTIRFTEQKIRKDGSTYLSEILMREIVLEGKKVALSVNRVISRKKNRS